MKTHSRVIARVLALVFVLGLWPALAGAQVQTGDLSGLVVDQQKLPLPGVTITVSSPRLIAGQQTATTSAQGFFRFTYLPPGPYKVTAELQGFSTQVTEGVTIQVGSTTSLQIAMQVGKLQEVVNVAAEAPIAALENTQLSNNVKADQLQLLPVQRRAASVLALSPGVTPTLAALGGSTGGNSFSVDGLYLNEPKSGREEVRQSVDVLQEVQVETAGHSAEYGNASGALLNAITKSGGNAFSGTANFTYQGKSLQGENYKSHNLTEPPEQLQYRSEVSFTVGGPILRDKAWFFAGISYIPEETKLQGFPERIPSNTLWPTAKLTVQPTASQRLSISATYNRYTNDYAGADPFTTVQATQIFKRESYSTVGNWLYTPNNTTTLEVRGALAMYPAVQEARVKTQNVWDLVTNIVSGGFGDTKNDQQRLLLAANATKFVQGKLGDHMLKTGFEVGRTSWTTTRTVYPDAYGMTNYTLQGGQPFFAFRLDPPDGPPVKSEYTELSGFLQDSWRINRYLFANPGVRITSIRQRIPTQAKVPSTLSIADWTDVEPRLGVGFDPTGDGKTAFRVHYGRYTSPMHIWYSRLNPNYPTTIYFLNPAPGTFIKVLEDKFDPSANVVDPDLARPYVDEFLVSADRRLPGNWALRGHFVTRRFRRFVTGEVTNWGTAWYPKTITSALTNQPITVYDTVASSPSPIQNYTNSPGAKRDYKGLSASLERQFTNGSFARVSYTWSRSEGTALQVGDALGGRSSGFMYWNDPNVNDFATGLLDEDRTHEVKLLGILQLPADTSLSLNYTGTSGTAYTRYQNFTQRLGVTQINLEKRGSQRYPFLHQLAIRGEKLFRIQGTKIGGFIEVDNPFNWDAVTSTFNRMNSPDYGKIMALQSARYALVGLRMTF